MIIITGQPALIFPTSYPQAGAMRMLCPMRWFTGPHDFVYVLRHASQLSKTPHFGRLWPPNSNSAEIFCTMHLPPSFIIPCLLIWKLSCWQTNKQTPMKTSNVLRYATMFGSCVHTGQYTFVSYIKWSSPTKWKNARFDNCNTDWAADCAWG